MDPQYIIMYIHAELITGNISLNQTAVLLSNLGTVSSLVWGKIIYR